MASHTTAQVFISAITTYLLISVGFTNGRYTHHDEKFLAPKPKEVIKSEGGSIEAWEEDFLQHADLAAAIITVEPQSLALPKYSDSACLGYVLHGKARVGLISPVGLRTNVWRIQRGEALAIPRGWALWIWNEDQSEQVRIVGVSETSTVSHAGEFRPFHLIGGDEEFSGGLVHGFSKEMLSLAWDVEMEDVEKLLKAQSQTGFVKVEGKDAPHESSTGEPSGMFLGDFVYNLEKSQADVWVENGGILTQLNANKLPVLKKVGLGLARVRLQPDAMVAPQYLTNAHRFIYVTKGKGYVEISHPDGRPGLHAEVTAGDALVVPPGYPTVERADAKEEFHYISFAGTPYPVASFLAGGNSLFHALPRAVRNAGFNIDEDLAAKFDRGRKHQFAIFPPKQEGGRGSAAWEKSAQELLDDMRRFVSNAHDALKMDLGYDVA